MSGGSLVIYDSTFSTNIAADSGGAIDIGGGTLVIHDSSFDTNSAGHRGGAISADHSINLETKTLPGGANVEIRDTVFEANTAGKFDSLPLVKKTSCSSSSPCGRCEGDCSMSSDCAAGMTCLFRSASDAIPGCASGGSGDVDGDDYCIEVGEGGALYLLGGEYKVSTSVFTRNKASVVAASRDIHITNGAHLSVYESNFPDNEREDFAAVFLLPKGLQLDFQPDHVPSLRCGVLQQLGLQHVDAQRGEIVAFSSTIHVITHLCISCSYFPSL